MSTPIGRLRSLLFTPAVRPDLVTKAAGYGADGVVIDCEDATAPSAKEEGRVNARRLADALTGTGGAGAGGGGAREGGGARRTQVFVRINTVASPWFEDDVAEGLSPRLAGVLLPKVETTDELDEAASALAEVGLGRLGIVAGIETALGVADARPLLAHPAVVAVYFGAEDFVADMGGVRTEGGAEALFARSAVALAARLAGLPALDQVVTDRRDDSRFVRESREARSLGYRGKLCVHPAQVLLANQAFLPTAAEVDRARRLLLAYEEAAGLGVAAIDFEGQVIDEALAAQARSVLATADDGP